MSNEALTNFEKWLDLYGQSRLAVDLKCSRQLVSSWRTKHLRPSDKFKEMVIGLSNGMLVYNDFYK